MRLHATFVQAMRHVRLVETRGRTGHFPAALARLGRALSAARHVPLPAETLTAAEVALKAAERAAERAAAEQAAAMALRAAMQEPSSPKLLEGLRRSVGEGSGLSAQVAAAAEGLLKAAEEEAARARAAQAEASAEAARARARVEARALEAEARATLKARGAEGVEACGASDVARSEAGMGAAAEEEEDDGRAEGSAEVLVQLPSSHDGEATQPLPTSPAAPPRLPRPSGLGASSRHLTSQGQLTSFGKPRATNASPSPPRQPQRPPGQRSPPPSKRAGPGGWSFGDSRVRAHSVAHAHYLRLAGKGAGPVVTEAVGTRVSYSSY